jgi:hypothetical protein
MSAGRRRPVVIALAIGTTCLTAISLENLPYGATHALDGRPDADRTQSCPLHL